jgi:hypothetical protein
MYLPTLYLHELDSTISSSSSPLSLVVVSLSRRRLSLSSSLSLSLSLSLSRRRLSLSSLSLVVSLVDLSLDLSLEQTVHSNKISLQLETQCPRVCCVFREIFTDTSHDFGVAAVGELARARLQHTWISTNIRREKYKRNEGLTLLERGVEFCQRHDFAIVIVKSLCSFHILFYWRRTL